MKREIALLLIASILMTSFGVVFILPVSAQESTLVIGTTDSVESAVDPAQAYDYQPSLTLSQVHKRDQRTLFQPWQLLGPLALVV